MLAGPLRLDPTYKVTRVYVCVAVKKTPQVNNQYVCISYNVRLNLPLRAGNISYFCLRPRKINTLFPISCLEKIG